VKTALSHKRPLLLLLGLALVLFSAGIWKYDLWPADEPRYAEIAREILQSKDWLVLHVNGLPYDEKPPLLFWSIAAVSAPFGDVTETTARIPSILSALLVLLFTYALARRMYDEKIAIWAVILLITSSRFWWQARTCQTDMMLTAFLTMALFAFYNFISTEQKQWLLVFYGSISLALFTKGPPGLVFPLLCLIVYFWRRPLERRRFHPLIGFLAAIVGVLLWLIPSRMNMTSAAQEATRQVLLWDILGQTVGRFALGISKVQGPWYFFINLPVDWLPWSLFLPFLLPWAWRKRKEDSRMRLLLSWTVPAFIFFSISIGKRQIYLLPIFPALAILMARGILEAVQSDRKKMLQGIGWVWGGCFVALALTMAILPRFTVTEDVRFDANTSFLLSAILAACAVYIFFFLRKKGYTQLHQVIAQTTAVLFLCLALFVFPELNKHKSAKDFCEPVRFLAEKGETFRLYSVGFSREEYVFYSKHFHEPVFTDILPMVLPEDLSRLALAKKQKNLRDKMISAVEAVPIQSITNVQDSDIDALQAALREHVYKQSGEDEDFIKKFEETLTQEVAAFRDSFFGNEPGFMFVQEQDWRWLIAFEPEFKKATVLRHQGVGRREVMLLANPKGAEKMVRMQNTSDAVSSTTYPMVIEIEAKACAGNTRTTSFFFASGLILRG